MNNFNINTRINPKGLKKDQYDVIIIGAGIGGLVCGCYLAKAGWYFMSQSLPTPLPATA